MAPYCGVCLREGAPPLLPHQSQRDLLCTHTEQLQAGGGDRLESLHLGGVGAGDHVAEHEREDHGLLGEQILSLAPLGLGGVTVELASFLNEGLQLVEGLGVRGLPAVTLLGPDVVTVPPGDDDAGVGAEDRGVAGGQDVS